MSKPVRVLTTLERLKFSATGSPDGVTGNDSFRGTSQHFVDVDERNRISRRDREGRCTQQWCNPTRYASSR